MEVILQPEIKRDHRIKIAIAAAVVILIVPYVSWWIKLPMVLIAVLLAGTYRISSVRDNKFRSRLFVAFMPMKVDKCNLPGVIYIETKYNAVGHVPDTLPFLAPLQKLTGLLFDLMTPALGGAFEVWLITAKGREIPAWQGFSEKHFEENMALLKARSSAEVRGRSI